MRGRAIGGGTAGPYRLLGEAVLRVSGLAGSVELVPYRAALGRVVADAATSELPAILGEGFPRLLGVLAPVGGVLLIVEDLHWADPETVDVLGYVVDNIAGQQLFCLASVRAGI